MTNEEQRLQASVEREVHWKRWGPYLSERQWGTVREDYSANGDVCGNISLTITPARAPIAGARMASAEFATAISTSASPSRSGTKRIPF